jgi:hypothetical protein
VSSEIGRSRQFGSGGRRKRLRVSAERALHAAAGGVELHIRRTAGARKSFGFLFWRHEQELLHTLKLVCSRQALRYLTLRRDAAGAIVCDSRNSGHIDYFGRNG